MFERYAVAIIGSGPAGLSAAAHAARLGLRHILLEAQPHLSDTIYKYQKGKHVMAEPGFLELRSPLHFEAGTRESILNRFDDEIVACGTLIQNNARVTAISGEKGRFWIALETGELIGAEQIVLGIGMQGNLRTLGVPGENLPGVQYQLDDPRAYGGETIIVVGAGDAAIENALALAENDNRVILLNRNAEFSRCKDGNLSAVQAAIREARLACRYSTSIDHLDVAEQVITSRPADLNATMMVQAVDLSKRQRGKAAPPGLSVVLNTPQGEEIIECHRVIARLGAIPPRKLVESFGIRFGSKDVTALPQLSPTYESTVPGIYVVGALGGYPLIKQAMNQGYEAIESICGRIVVPADQPLLEQKFAAVLKAHPELGDVDAVLAMVGTSMPWLQSLSALQLRELMLESEIRLPKAGEVIFRRNDYSNSFFSIVRGRVRVKGSDTDPEAKAIVLGAGNFFGEMGLISGRRRSAKVRAAEACILVETPSRSMLKLLASVDAVRRELDEVALRRAVRKYVASDVSEEQLSALIEGSQIRKYKAGDALFSEGDKPDGLYLIRKGSVMVSRTIGGREVVLSYVSAGNYVGEMALMLNAPRSATVRAAVPAEAIVLEARKVTDVLAVNTGMRSDLDQKYLARLQANESMEANQRSGNLISFLLQQGVGEATDVLLIDESLCIRCDHCEKACADTHFGTSRLDREAGPTFDNLHVPTSCRHCEHPHCMKDCPPDAIHRSPSGEVFITDACIGCGNCEKNCPYGVIQMAPLAGKRGINSLWAWLLTGLGHEPGTRAPRTPVGGKDALSSTVKKAVKCDMCKDISSGPACVRACPTGAALRISPEKFLDYAGGPS
ncbi:cyclic nucleotide-binding domain-containing protein [Comamonadaceae bacterium G21597-S1]|nr:cyclic nucleotide-binding domain-containing protein [Comamonadaceae bacterium G21597-S1]